MRTVIRSRQTGRTIEMKMARALLVEGVQAQVTLCRMDLFSVLTLERAAHDKAKAIFATVGGVALDSEDDTDQECGFFLYYRF